MRPELGAFTTAKKPRWAVLISGRGSNLAALLELLDEVEIRVVMSSSAQAQGLLRARRAGVPARLTPFIEGSKKIDWTALSNSLKSFGVSHIFLAGFMKVVPAGFIAEWRGRILNLHPSILPSYPGLKSIERAHVDRADLGATVHDVVEDVDAGRVICQRRTLKADEIATYNLATAEFLVHVDEQRLIREAIRRWPIEPAS